MTNGGDTDFRLRGGVGSGWEGQRVQHASACPATLTLALTFCCLSREHVITLRRVQTARENKREERKEKIMLLGEVGKLCPLILTVT